MYKSNFYVYYLYLFQKLERPARARLLTAKALFGYLVIYTYSLRKLGLTRGTGFFGPIPKFARPLLPSSFYNTQFTTEDKKRENNRNFDYSYCCIVLLLYIIVYYSICSRCQIPPHANFNLPSKLHCHVFSKKLLCIFLYREKRIVNEQYYRV